MRQKRCIRNRRKREKITRTELDITSLLDILVITLVFLLKSYNSSGFILNTPKGITLPKSKSLTVNTSGTIIQVSQSKVWVDDKIILNTAKMPAKAYDQNGRRIVPLYNELVRRKEIIKQIKDSSLNAEKFTGKVNLVIDKNVKFNFIKKLLYTTAEAGYKQYKFIVLGEES